MKLKKREITLNEADSMKDVFFIEQALYKSYDEGAGFAFRKETANELAALKGMAQGEAERIKALWVKAKKEQI